MGNLERMFVRLRLAQQTSAPNDNERLKDPLRFYQENYPNVSKGNLYKVDRGLFNLLKRMGLLGKVPTLAQLKYGEDPLKFYEDNYKSIGRANLSRKDNHLYTTLKRRGLLEKIPLKYKPKIIFEDPLKFYEDNYEGVTRGKLQLLNGPLYKALKRRGLLKHVPIVHWQPRS